MTKAQYVLALVAAALVGVALAFFVRQGDPEASPSPSSAAALKTMQRSATEPRPLPRGAP